MTVHYCHSPLPRYHPLDFCIAASTGSGKTLAYALPVLQVLAQQRMCGYIGALVVVPDAHLASQVKTAVTCDMQILSFT